MANIDKKYIDAILTDIQKEKLSQIAMDEDMLEALKKVLLFSLYNSGTVKKGVEQDFMQNAALVWANNPKVSDKELADNSRALYQGLNALQLGLDDIARYKLEPMPELEGNEAR